MMKQVIESYLQRHEQFLRCTLDDVATPANRLKDALFYCVFPGGKRLRPMLVYLLGELNQVDLKILDLIAAAIELTHCYSLVHDDLPAMDNDDYRRGKLTCHKAFDEATAILIGDGLQALAIEILTTHLKPILAADSLVQVITALVRASGISGMVSGQSLDLSELARADLTEQELSAIHHLKTGTLIAACGEMVLAAKPIDPVKKQAITTYTSHLGLVFQMQDDYLDKYHAVETLGKGRSSDAKNHKTTFATLYSQQELAQKIDLLFEQALTALECFADKAQSLITLTKQLQQRTMVKE